MSEVAKPMTDDDLRAFGEWVAKLPPPRPPERAGGRRAHQARRGAGAAAALHVLPQPDFSGREQMPRLAHQREEYLLRAMREYKSGARIGYGSSMTEELVGLSDADLQDIAYFLANLPTR